MGLIAAAVIPVWLFAAYLLISFARSEQSDYREQAILLARQSADSLEGELRAALIRLDGLARSSAMADGRLEQIHAEARRLVEGTSQIILLRDFGSNQFFNTAVDFASSLPPAIPLQAEELQAFQSGSPWVSDVYRSPISGELRIAVVRPVVLRGNQNALLAVTLPTTTLRDLLVSTVPAGWVVGVADRADIYVTRSARHDEVAGTPGVPEYIEKAVGTAGAFTATNQFGDVWLAGYYRSSFSDWLYGANIALAVVEAPFWKSIYGILSLGAAALSLSLLLTFFVGKRLAVETGLLAASATALGRGEPVIPTPTRLSEYAVVGNALIAAEKTLKKRTRELEAVLETAPVAVWFTYDPEGIRVIRNRFAAELMGLSTEDHSTFGVTDTVINTIATKDGVQISRDDRPLTRSMRGKHTDNEEFVYVLPSGRQLVLLTSARPIRDDAGQIIGAVQVSLDITDRKRGEEERRLLASELSHRVKNNLAVVQALAQQTLRGAKDLADARGTLRSRLAALGRAHDVLTHHSWADGDLREVMEAGLASQAHADRVDLSGPQISIPARLVMVVTLVFHELTTNAIKYGALSNSTGRISISWWVSVDSDVQTVFIRWIEAGGPPVSQPGHRGFGSELLEGMVASEGGHSTHHFDPTGFSCTIRFRLAEKQSDLYGGVNLAESLA